MTKNSKQSSPAEASKAGSILSNPNASATAKSLAGSVVAQANTGKQTGPKMETVASKVLQSPKYSPDTKSLAGSVLSQTPKGKK